MKRLNQSGQGLTEYIMLVLLISVVSIAATKTLGTRVKSKIKEASDHINSDITLEERSGSRGVGSDGN